MTLKIDKQTLLRALPFFIVMTAFVSFLSWQVRINVALRQEIDEKKKEFKKAEAASRHLRNLEKQIIDLRQKQEALYRKVPLDEKEPFGLIRALIRLGGEAGLRGITVNLKEKDAEASEKPVQPPEETPAPQPAAAAQPGVSPVYLEMSFDGSFQQVMLFLSKLISLERIVKVEGARIERKKETFPYQKVSLDLVTYTFLK